MKKKLLCYDADNPVGVDSNGVLDPNAMGGGIAKLSDYAKIDMYTHPALGDTYKAVYIQIDSIPVGNTILFNDITEVDENGYFIDYFVYQRGDGTTLWNAAGDNTGNAFMQGSVSVVCLFVCKETAANSITVYSLTGKDVIDLSNNTISGNLLKYE